MIFEPHPTSEGLLADLRCGTIALQVYAYLFGQRRIKLVRYPDHMIAFDVAPPEC